MMPKLGSEWIPKINMINKIIKNGGYNNVTYNNKIESIKNLRDMQP
jgi:hypothetical protein